MFRKLPFLFAGTLFACAASLPPPELLNARAAYQRSADGPAAQNDPAALHIANEALARAERSFNDHGDGQDTRDLAYVAQRKAELADAEAQVKVAEAQKATAVDQAQLTQGQIERKALTDLSATQQALATEQQRRADAERKAAQAMADMARIASVKQEPRGMVISLSGAVLFTSGKSDILPQAQTKLSEVTEALLKTDPDAPIRIEGYTDTQGSLSFNQTLSQQRADAVRTYFTSHGVAPDRVTAVGLGPAQPVADNATAEGRADNRRVEIIVQNKSSNAKASASSTNAPN